MSAQLNAKHVIRWFLSLTPYSFCKSLLPKPCTHHPPHYKSFVSVFLTSAILKKCSYTYTYVFVCTCSLSHFTSPTISSWLGFLSLGEAMQWFLLSTSPINLVLKDLVEKSWEATIGRIAQIVHEFELFIRFQYFTTFFCSIVEKNRALILYYILCVSILFRYPLLFILIKLMK